MSDPSDISHNHNGHTNSIRNRNPITRGQVLAVIIVLVLCGLSFWGGSEYQKGRSPATNPTSTAASTTPNGGQGFGGRRFGGGQRAVFGTVTAVSSTSISVKNSRTGSTSALTINSSTTITSNGQTASVNDIKVGDSVLVRPSGSDSTVAASILLNPQIPGDPNSVAPSDTQSY